MVRPLWRRQQAHVRLFRRSVALAVVAREACTDEVLPLVSTAARSWYHVIHR